MRFLIVLICTLLFTIAARSQPRVTFRTSGKQQFTYPADSLENLMHFKNYDAIIFGETHTINFEPYFKFQLIRQLHAEQGIRDVFMEIGHSAAFIFNRYLNTGDTSLFKYLHIVYSPANKGYKPFWDSLYHYNNSLPADKKLIIHGVDFERTEVFQVLTALQPEGKLVPHALTPFFDLLGEAVAADFTDHFSKEFVAEFDQLRAVMQENLPEIAGYYGADSALVRAIANNDGPHTSGTRRRNKSMFRNMSELIAEKGITRFAGFFGSAHTTYKQNGTLPNRIKTLGAFKDKTLVMNTVYFNAYSTSTKTILPYVGAIKKRARQELYDRYLIPGNRAVMLHCNDLGNKSLRGSADFVLLVNDIVE